MANLKEIRLRINTVKNTQQVTKAMKMVSAAKLRKAQDRMIQLRPYAGKLKEIISNVVSSVELSQIPSKLVEQRDVKNVLLLVVTSNRGLCGPFNSNLLKFVNNFIDENLAEFKSSGNLHVMGVGRKGFEFFNKRKFKMVEDRNHDVLSNLTFDNVNAVTERVLEGFLKGEWDKVYLCFNEFRNVMVQNRVADQLLPLEIIKDENQTFNTDYIFEPNRNDILVDLIPKSIRTQVFRAVLESNASEHGARMVAMDQATENGNALLKDLKLTYNKARQAAITKEILEIAGGADALANA